MNVFPANVRRLVICVVCGATAAAALGGVLRAQGRGGAAGAPVAAQSGAPLVPDRPTAPAPNLPPVTSQDLVDGLKNPSRWLSYSGDYTGRRHSPLKQITPGNVGKLSLQWMFQAEGMAIARGFESIPLMHDGVMYISGNNNLAWAVDARTGRQIWRYRRAFPPGMTYGGANPSNRGLALLGNLVYMATLDAHVVALDRNTGRVVWDTVMDDYKLGHAGIAAPLVVKDKVIVGNSGGDLPTRGFIDAFDAQTGKRAWRFYTIPGPGEPGSETWSDASLLARGGGATWATGSYDPDLNTIYWATGNPQADYYGDDRLGDNLYTASLVALDADTGKLKWHFQFTPHDLHDWDSNHVPVLADITFRGQPRKVVMVANRNSFFYTLDRVTGEFLLGKPYTNTKWARELDAKGRPIVLNNGVIPPGGSEATTPCVPDLRGGTVYNPPSYDPVVGLFYVMSRETCAYYTPQKQELEPGRTNMGGGTRKLADPDYSVLRAIDPGTGAIRWEHKFGIASLAGVMSTASGVVFAGDHEGFFNAFDSKNGKLLWRFRTGSPIWGTAGMSYMLDGKQYVLIPSGNTVLAFGLP
jgi:alcohol dehydrogenase (cytochrome c)